MHYTRGICIGRVYIYIFVLYLLDSTINVGNELWKKSRCSGINVINDMPCIVEVMSQNGLAYYSNGTNVMESRS